MLTFEEFEVLRSFLSQTTDRYEKDEEVDRVEAKLKAEGWEKLSKDERKRIEKAQLDHVEDAKESDGMGFGAKKFARSTGATPTATCRRTRTLCAPAFICEAKAPDDGSREHGKALLFWDEADSWGYEAGDFRELHMIYGHKTPVVLESVTFKVISQNPGKPEAAEAPTGDS